VIAQLEPLKEMENVFHVLTNVLPVLVETQTIVMVVLVKESIQTLVTVHTDIMMMESTSTVKLAHTNAQNVPLMVAQFVPKTEFTHQKDVFVTPTMDSMIMVKLIAQNAHTNVLPALMLTHVLLVLITSDLLVKTVSVHQDITMMELKNANNVTILVKHAQMEMLVPHAKI
jgi:hypothetical protein